MPDTRAQYAQNPETMLRDAGHWQPKGSPERKLFEDRLYSDEPFATFGQANSLAGYLAAWLVVAFGAAFFHLSRRQGNLATLGMLIAVAVIGGCLLLTKSRSA